MKSNEYRERCWRHMTTKYRPLDSSFVWRHPKYVINSFTINILFIVKNYNFLTVFKALYETALPYFARMSYTVCDADSTQKRSAVSILRRQLAFNFRRNATHFVSPYAIVVCLYISVCVFVCLSVCVYAASVDARKTVWDRDVVF